jgi:hypothetical protein
VSTVMFKVSKVSNVPNQCIVPNVVHKHIVKHIVVISCSVFDRDLYW